MKVNWEKNTKSDYDKGTFIIMTRRNVHTFTGKDAYSLACWQALALSRFAKCGGRYLVYAYGENDEYAKVMYDECIQRIGVKNDHNFAAHTCSNSGTMSWKEARTFDIGLDISMMNCG
jgi:hypothetical protein